MMGRRSTPADFWAQVRKTAYCWVWQSRRGLNDYGMVKYHQRDTYAHRLAWELTHGPIPPGMYVCHRCDNPPCCNPEHLFLGTATENQADARRKNRLRHGAKHPMARLTEDDVLDIRAAAAFGASHRDIAKAYGVSYGAAYGVVARLSWKHLP